MDTNTLFSAIYSRTGNEAKLLEKADEGHCIIIILDHVLYEIDRVLDDKSIGKEKFHDLLDTYENIVIEEMNNITQEEIHLAIDMIHDPGDRPLFVFAKRMIDQDQVSYLVSGDRIFFQEKINSILKNKVRRTKEIIDMID